MKLKLTYIFTITLLTITLCFLYSFSVNEDTDVVSVKDRQLLINKTAYFIKGICYHPVPKGSDQRDFSNLSEDLKLMLESTNRKIKISSPNIIDLVK